MANTKELTPTEIASMSEVVAKYMGKNIYEEDGVLWVTENGCDVDFHNWAEYHSSWDWIHEVLEKVKNEKHEDVNLNFHISLKLDAVKWCLVNGTPLESFTALFDCIEIINNLKQTNDNSNI